MEYPKASDFSRKISITVGLYFFIGLVAMMFWLGGWGLGVFIVLAAIESVFWSLHYKKKLKEFNKYKEELRKDTKKQTVDDPFRLKGRNVLQNIYNKR